MKTKLRCQPEEGVHTPPPCLKAGGEEANFAAGYGTSKAGGEDRNFAASQRRRAAKTNFAAGRREEVNTPPPRLKAGGEEANFAAGYGASKAGGEVPRCRPREGAMTLSFTLIRQAAKPTSLPAEGGGEAPPLKPA